MGPQIAEGHPFLMVMGRIVRVMMNAELTAGGIKNYNSQRLQD